METNLKTQILERKAYIAGLDKFITLPENNEVFNFSKEDFDSGMKNNRVSNDVNTFYTSSLRGLFFWGSVFQSYMELMSYIIYNRQSEIGNEIFTRDYVVLPLSYKEIYQMLITLPKLEADRIIAKMNLSVNTINNLITAFKEKSEELFITCLEKEPKDLTVVCRQLRVYNNYFNINNNISDIININSDTDIDSVFSDIKFILINLCDFKDDDFKDDLNYSIKLIKQFIYILENIHNYIFEEHTIEINAERIENLLFNNSLKPDCLLNIIKLLFTKLRKYYKDFPLLEEENNCINALFTRDKLFQDIIEYSNKKIQSTEKNKEYPDKGNNSCRLNKPDGWNKEMITILVLSLANNQIIDRDSMSNLKHFLGFTHDSTEFVEKVIDWYGSRNSLKYFISILYNNEVPKGTWQAVQQRFTVKSKGKQMQLTNTDSLTNLSWETILENINCNEKEIIDSSITNVKK